MKKSTLIFLTLILVLLVPSAVYGEKANNEPNSVKVSVSQIVPQSEINKYKGKFKSYDEVYAAYGLTKESHKKPQKEAIIINNVDELAALIGYTKQQHSKSFTHQNLSSPKSIKLPDLLSYEQVISDSKVWWIKGYADVSVDNQKNSVTAVTASTQIHGFHLGITYTPSQSTANISSDKRGFTAIFRGAYSYNIIIADTSSFISVPVSGTMNKTVFYSA
ncbi:hypothetical protein I6N90_04850 [Paenibacillus sp. GSMTC-2017]|uniref:hypothetical protein n=1 Tax=Paenibacillus sp. GSMTC-2017 TaxID=2794350 RepID=UPI0018D7E4B4|nr:hypothetical protein [Paenibacillus sp. GSMTC-2017]MBH5317137.1 hypothetical protein [Paenibacillus sp. GSMTC-2017]